MPKTNHDMKTPNIGDFDPKIQQQVIDWITRWKSRLIREAQAKQEEKQAK